jgi:hypothetical protein
MSITTKEISDKYNSFFNTNKSFAEINEEELLFISFLLSEAPNLTKENIKNTFNDFNNCQFLFEQIPIKDLYFYGKLSLLSSSNPNTILDGGVF